MIELQKILQAVREAVEGTVKRKVTDDEALVTVGVIDSLLILRLIAEIERKLGIRIQTANIQPEDFDTVELGAETVERTMVLE